MLNVNFLSLKIINKTIRVLLAFLILVNIGAGFLSPLFAIFIENNIVGATLITVGISSTLYAIFKSVTQLYSANFLDKHPGEKDDFYFLLCGSLINVIYFFTFIFVDQIWQLYTLQIIIGIGDAFLMAAYYAIFSHHIDGESQGFEWSLFSVGGLTFSTAVGALLGGIIAENLGFDWIFIIAGSFNVVAIIIIFIFLPALLRIRKKDLENSITRIHRR